MNVPVPVYGAVPPFADIVTVEVPPLHNTAVWLFDTTNKVGSVTVTETDLVQPFASVTVYDCVPAAWLKVPVPA